MADISTLTLDVLVDKYVKIRDAKKAASDAFKKETERMTAAMTKLEGLIQLKLNESGATSIKTEFGTAFTKTRSAVSVQDRDEFYNWAVANNQLGAIDMKANAKAVRELLQEGTEVPGVKYSESLQVGVRRA